jgi:hypothetical protein
MGLTMTQMDQARTFQPILKVQNRRMSTVKNSHLRSTLRSYGHWPELKIRIPRFTTRRPIFLEVRVSFLEGRHKSDVCYRGE